MADVKITVKLPGAVEAISREIAIGTDLESLTAEYQSDLPYKVMAALVDNIEEDLRYVIKKECDIILLDCRDSFGDRTYQRSLCMVYLKAIRDVLGDVDTDILNALNRGLFTRIHTSEPITDAQIEAVEARMQEIVDADLPIHRTVVSRKELLKSMTTSLSGEKIELIAGAPDVHYIAVYDLDGYSTYFYGRTVPSTGYLQIFELRRYESGVILRYPHPLRPDRLPIYVNDHKLYAAFNEGWNIASAFGLSYAADLNRAISEGDTGEIIALAERLHGSGIRNIAKTIAESKKRVVLIAGPSSSGKTTFAKRLAAGLAENGLAALYMGTDDYYLERAQSPVDEKGEHNFEGLDALDVDLFNSDVEKLLEYREVDLPRYDFLQGKKVYGERISKLGENELIVIEGIHALNPHMTEKISDEHKFRVYISPLTQLGLDDHNRISATDVRLIRRIIRDARTRGSDAAETIKEWPKVRRGEDENIFPYNNEADMIFNSALIYELAVLRKHAEKTLSEVSPDVQEYATVVRLLDFLRFFNYANADELVPADSILREFIGE